MSTLNRSLFLRVAVMRTESDVNHEWSPLSCLSQANLESTRSMATIPADHRGSIHFALKSIGYLTDVVQACLIPR